MRSQTVIIISVGLFIVLFSFWHRDKWFEPRDERRSIEKDVCGDNRLIATKSDRIKSPLFVPRSRGSHLPESLSKFILPSDFSVENVTLKEAMSRLKSVYKETCYITGEVPLEISFKYPTAFDNTSLISACLGGSFSDAVKYLAVLSGLYVEQEGVKYCFSFPPENMNKPKVEVYNVPKNLLSDIASRYVGDLSEVENLNIKGISEALGIRLDENTYLNYIESTSRLIVTSKSLFDFDAITFLTVPTGVSTLQTRFETTTVAVSSDAAIELPKANIILPDELELFLKQASSASDVDVITMPSIVSRCDVPATLDMLDRHQLGYVLELSSVPVGLGANLNYHLQYYGALKNLDTGEIQVEKLIDLDRMSYTDDQNTSVSIEYHSDGSKTVLLITPSLIGEDGKSLNSDSNKSHIREEIKRHVEY